MDKEKEEKLFELLESIDESLIRIADALAGDDESEDDEEELEDDNP